MAAEGGHVDRAEDANHDLDGRGDSVGAEGGHHAAPSTGDLPGGPRLQLDLLDQIIERAGELRSTQGRLRGLLRATHHVAADHDPNEVLTRLVDAARDLIGARWAALGLLHDGLMTQVVHRPDDAALVRMLRRLPVDTGVLGSRVDDPRSARVDDLIGHPDVVPEVRTHDIAIRSFLCAPVRAGSATYGNLYLADERTSAFRDDDEQLLVALAAAAGVAVRNAVLLTRARRQQHWNQAGTDLAMRLLSQDAGLTESWQALLEVAVDVADAHGATLTSRDPADPESIEVVAAAGRLASWRGRHITDAKALTHVVLDTGQAAVVHDATTDPHTTELSTLTPEVTSVLAAPIPDPGAGENTPRSVLTLTRSHGQDPFQELEVDMVHGFAAQAATTLALAQARHDQERLARLEDREHTVRALQHSVFAQLQRSTLTLANVAGQIDSRLQNVLLDQIDSLEQLMRSIRTSVFDVPR